MSSIVFIDKGVRDWNDLLIGLDADVGVVLLDTMQDGVLQMAQALIGVDDLDSIHILSHGADGTLVLGNTLLTTDNLSHWSDEWAAIGASLRPGGDILIYGCDVAQTENGQYFVQQISRLTRAEVAASADVTGASVRGGNWQLEVNTGEIDATALSLPSYANVLTIAPDPLFVPSVPFKVNAFTTFDFAPKVAALSDGGYLVAWTSSVNSNDIYARRFDADGLALGVEFRVNSTTIADQSYPTVAGLANGDFIVTWQSNIFASRGLHYEVFAQEYSALGLMENGEFRVNSSIFGSQHSGRTVGLTGGGFVVVWSSISNPLNLAVAPSQEIFAHRYDAAGFELGGEFLVNLNSANYQSSSAVAASPAGGFVVTWLSSLVDDEGHLLPNGYAVSARRYGAEGGALGSEFSVDTNGYGVAEPAVAVAASGAFMVAWSSYLQDGSDYGIYAQVFDAEGGTQRAALRVNTTTAGFQGSPSVTALANGDFLVTWETQGGIDGQLYDAKGIALGTELNLVFSSASQHDTEAIGDGFVVTWRSGDSIFAEQFNTAPLFTIGTDFVNFNHLTAGQISAIDAGAEKYKALKGDDTIALPDSAHYQTLTNNTSWDPTKEFDAGLGKDTFDFTVPEMQELKTFTNGAIVKLYGGSGDATAWTRQSGIANGDQWKLPNSPADYDIKVSFQPGGGGPTWDATHILVETKTNTAAALPHVTIDARSIESVSFSKQIANPISGIGTAGAKDIDLAAEAARLAWEVYGPQSTVGYAYATLEHQKESLAYESAQKDELTIDVSKQARAREWHPVSALELGILPADFATDNSVAHPYGTTLRYSFVQGHYQAYDLAQASDPILSLIPAARGDLPEANALLLTGEVNGKKTLAISFRGTDQIADFDDYINFQTHYQKFQPLLDGIGRFLGDSSNGIQQVLVAGHSLGAGMVQRFLSESFLTGKEIHAYTFGSPGSDGADLSPEMLINFLHTDDPVPLAQDATSLLGKAQLAALGLVAADAGIGLSIVFQLPSLAGLISFGSVLYATLVYDVAPKERSGSNVVINSDLAPEQHFDENSILRDLWNVRNVKFLEHNMRGYLADVLKLQEFAKDPFSPFFNVALTDIGKVATGTPFDHDVGKPNHEVYSRFIHSLPTDTFVLGNNNRDDQIYWDGPQFGNGYRIVDGGDGVDSVFFASPPSDWDFFPSGVNAWTVHYNPGNPLAVARGELHNIEKVIFRAVGEVSPVQKLDGSPVSVQVNTSSADVPFVADPFYDYSDAGNSASVVIGSTADDTIVFGGVSGSVAARATDNFLLSGFVVGSGAQVSMVCRSTNPNTVSGQIGKTVAINGGDGNDIILSRAEGGTVHDVVIIDGGPGQDIMNGGIGTNIYIVDDTSDAVIDGGGYDEVRSTVNYVLPEGTEKLTLLGEASSGTGNDLDNVIVGNAADNVLDGGLGLDTVLYSGLRSSYTVIRRSITTTVSGPDGTDILTGIEKLQFAGTTISTMPPWAVDGSGDGKSDVLWRNSTGEVALWLMDGLTPTAQTVFGAVPVTTSIVDGNGDYNGDGKSDILWRDNAGNVTLWLMNGITPTSQTSIGSVPNTWTLVDGHGDYNGDGKDDLLWRNSNGDTALWLMNGSAFLQQAVFGAIPTNWSLIDGSGDYNGDGKGDLLWRNSTGDTALWLMDGVTPIGQSVFGSVPTTWNIVDGHGDYNGDGNSDLLWRNNTGDVALWLMNGLTPIGQAVFGSVPTTWSIVEGHGDYNGDGNSDVLWRNSTGDTALWLMNGVTPIGQAVFGSVPNTWTIVDGHSDYNGDGNSDLLWRNSTGDVAQWLMSGLTPIGQAVFANVPTTWSITTELGGLLSGDNAADTLTGTTARDTLIGNGGADTLAGGTGADTFQYNATTDSTVAASDRITDFAHGIDKIDLSLIDANTLTAGDQAFLFGGNNVNTVANGVTWSEGGGNTTLHIDNTGDTTADMQVVLTGVGLGLTAADFGL